MKQIIFLIISFVLLSCKKDNNTNPINQNGTNQTYEVTFSGTANPTTKFNNDLSKYTLSVPSIPQPLYMLYRGFNSVELSPMEQLPNLRNRYKIFKSHEFDENYTEIGTIGGINGSVIGPFSIIDYNVDLERNIYKFTTIILYTDGTYSQKSQPVRNICLKLKEKKIYWNHYSTSKDTTGAVYGFGVLDSDNRISRYLKYDSKTLSFDIESDKDLFSKSSNENFIVFYTIPSLGVSVFSNTLKIKKK